MVKSYSLSHQPFSESEDVMKTLKSRGNVLKAQKIQKYQRKKQSILSRQHESPADLQSLQASRSSSEALGKAQNIQKFTGMVTPG